MDLHCVQNKAELMAAIQASAHYTFQDARNNPFEVHLGRTVFKFSEGVVHRRADQITRQIRRTPASVFAVKETPDIASGVKTNLPGVRPCTQHTGSTSV